METSGSRMDLLTGKWTSLIYSLVLLASVYGLGYVGGERVYAMIYLRGLIPHFIIFVSALALGYLLHQYLCIRRSIHNLSRLRGFVQNSREEIVALAKVDQAGRRDQAALINQLHSIVPAGRENDLIASLLKDWVESGQDFAFKRLEVLLDLEVQASESSFRIPSVLGWMAPMLGFLGTVWGIAQSLGNFTGFMSDVDNVSRIKDGLGTITAGLGIAFDTTLLGLFFAIIITGVTTYLQRREDAYLDGLERTAMEVLKRLSLGSSKPRLQGAGADPIPSDAAKLGAFADAARDLIQKVQNENRDSATLTTELTDALVNFRHYVKYLAKIAKQSDLMASEIKSVESAAEAIRNLRDFTESLDNLNLASRDLLAAVKILERPREFRLVQEINPAGDASDD
ncbi:MAG: MotA/TolQ/ExbB proton channel family protein [Pseudomonadota bacterium]